MQHVTSLDIRSAIRDLGISGLPVCVHSSLRSFGQVEGGAEAVVEAFLAESCTLLVPAFSWAFFVSPRAARGPLRNAFDYGRVSESSRAGPIYTPMTDEIDASMGAVPRAVVERPGRTRGAHPLSSFAAVGPDAEVLVGAQAPLDAFAPLRLLAQGGGFVLLIGVGLTSMTLLHLAEACAGREPFRRWATAPSGDVIEVQTGGCSAGFGAFERVLAPLAREAVVGASRWRSYPAGAVVEEATRALQANPQITHCDNPACEQCRDAIAGGPLVA